jgi:hypothetical protein
MARPAVKRSKGEVDYSEGSMREHCGICKHFIKPSACQLVTGHILARMWCKLFERGKA